MSSLAAAILLYASTSSLALPFDASQERASQKQRLDELLEREVRDSKLAGLAVAVMYRGKPEYVRCLGLPNLDNGAGVKTTTPFNLASLTKNFTAVGVMKLVEKGKLKLDEPVSTYLKSAPRSWEGITVRHLLSHQSGIPDYTKYPEFRQVYMKEISRAAVLKWAMESPLEFKPGSSNAYSNTGFVVLGHLIAAVSGRTYFDFLNSEVFMPSGMKNLSLDEPGRNVRDKALAYELQEGSLRKATEVAKGWSFAAGGLNASLQDLMNWDRVVSARSLLKPSSWSAMWKVETEELQGRPLSYGLGWVLHKIDGRSAVGHFGDKPGFSSLYFHFPESGRSIIVLANRTNANALGIAGRIHEALSKE